MLKFCSIARYAAKASMQELVRYAQSLGDETHLIDAAGVSPSQASVECILQVDLYGTSMLLEEFGQVIAPGGSGVIISSQSGHRLPALPQEQNEALAMTPVDELLQLPFLCAITDTLKLDDHCFLPITYDGANPAPAPLPFGKGVGS